MKLKFCSYIPVDRWFPLLLFVLITGVNNLMAETVPQEGIAVSGETVHLKTPAGQCIAGMKGITLRDQ